MAIVETFIPREDPTTTNQQIDAREVTHDTQTVIQERIVITGGQGETVSDVHTHTGGSVETAFHVVETPKAQTQAHGAVSVATTATLIRALNDTRKELTIRNVGANDIYLGGASVTTADGMTLEPGETWVVTRFTGAVYGIVAAATENVRFWEFST